MDTSLSFSLPTEAGSSDTMDLSINNVMAESVSLYPFIQNIGRRLHLSQEFVSSIVIALEEQFLNVIRYAYPRGEEGVITLKARWHKATNTLKFTMIDHGMAYDPTEQDTGHQAERPLGAIGINMLSQLMDTVDYVRRAGSNILHFTKRIASPLMSHEDRPDDAGGEG